MAERLSYTQLVAGSNPASRIFEFYSTRPQRIFLAIRILIKPCNYDKLFSLEPLGVGVDSICAMI